MTRWGLRTDPAVVRQAIAYARTHSYAATGRHLGVADTAVASWTRMADQYGPDWPPLELDAWWQQTAAFRKHRAAGVAAFRKRRYLGLGPWVVDSTGTRRRLQALMRLGWSTPALARRGGWGTPEAVQRLCKQHLVTVRNRDRVARLYDDLSMIPGRSLSTTRYAEQQGWPPPLAWDDIDHDETPVPDVRQHSRPGRPTVANARVEDAEWMADADETLTGACARLGITQDGLWKACRRVGRLDVYDRLARRELNGDMRTEVRTTMRTQGTAA